MSFHDHHHFPFFKTGLALFLVGGLILLGTAHFHVGNIRLYRGTFFDSEPWMCSLTGGTWQEVDPALAKEYLVDEDLEGCIRYELVW